MKRVVITGMGVVAPVGHNVPDFWAALCQGVSGIRPITRFDTAAFDIKQGGEIAGFNFPAALGGDQPAPDIASRFLMVAAAEAMRASGLDSFPEGRAQTGVVVATNFGGANACEPLLGAAAGRDPADPRALFHYSFQQAADDLAARWQLQGPRSSWSLSCASGTAALGYAYELIGAGRATAMVAGGYDALSRFCWSGLSALRTMTRDKLRPFDRNRGGTIFGEGAGVLIVEELEQARRRGAPLLAEIIGYGLTNNAYHMTAPDKGGEGLRLAMAMALDHAGLRPEQVDHINTHGTGTKYNDLTETQAIKTLFGKHAYDIPLTANKSMTGHTMGAAGAMEAIATVLAIRDGMIPPTINYATPDPECDLNYTPNTACARSVTVALSNSAGIGGCNATILFRKVT